jgi:hypothetical protein
VPALSVIEHLDVVEDRSPGLIYLGARHMATGYDHLLFLAGVIFFLYRLKEVAAYVKSGHTS